MQALTLQPISKIDGTIYLPGSKSISNRALLIAALAQGTTKITNLLVSDDTRHMLTALQQLGIEYTLSNNDTECTITGNGGKFNWTNKQELYLGNAGTAMRSLAAALNLKQSANSTTDHLVLTGDERMQERPIKPLVDALLQLGCKIEYQKENGYPPIAIYNQGIYGGKVSIDGSLSSQYITALLIVLPLVENDSEIEIIGDLVSKPYIDITIDMLAKFGVMVEHKNYQNFYIKGRQQYKAVEHYLVEGDASSASYFLAAAAIKGKVKVVGIDKNSIQGDRFFAEVLEQMGAKVEWGNNYIAVEQAPLNGIDVDLNHIPDAAMTIAIAGLFAKGSTTIRNIYNWRIKETDRLIAMSNELRKVGAEVEEGEDYIVVHPPKEFKHAEIETYNDHRMAMCFSLVALSNQAVTILDPNCTSKTFPTFFSEFAKLYQ